MTAGMIRVPTIVPLRPPSNGRKNMIDTRTPIELLSETSGALIYYTVNGTKPDPFQKLGEKFTYRYYKPFILGAGKRTVKAMATSSNGTRESSVVTKMFLVEEAELEERGGDLDLENLRNSRQPTAKGPSGLLNPMKNLGLNEIHATSMGQAQNGWISHDHQGKKSDAQVSSSLHRKSKGETKFGRREDVRSPEYLGLLLDRPSGSTYQDSGMRPEAEYMKCIYCFAPRPSDPYSTFCNDCGSPLPQPAASKLSPLHSNKLGMCKVCHLMVPLNTPTCMICEAAMAPQWLTQESPRPLVHNSFGFTRQD